MSPKTLWFINNNARENIIVKYKVIDNLKHKGLSGLYVIGSLQLLPYVNESMSANVHREIQNSTFVSEFWGVVTEVNCSCARNNYISLPTVYNMKMTQIINQKWRFKCLSTKFSNLCSTIRTWPPIKLCVALSPKVNHQSQLASRTWRWWRPRSRRLSTLCVTSTAPCRTWTTACSALSSTPSGTTTPPKD